MRGLILAGMIALSACTPEAPPVTETPGMSSIVSFAPTRFAGRWYEVATIDRAKAGAWQVNAGPDGQLHVATAAGSSGGGTLTGPGRFTLTNFDAPLWVLWADADYRTVVIGTPDRSFAIILDRSRAPSADRMRAARDILKWNGYDPRKLT